MSSAHLIDGKVDELAERLAIRHAQRRTRSGGGVQRVSEHEKVTPDTSTYWFIHLSRLSIRIMVQSAYAAGVDLEQAEAWGHMDRQWLEGVRRFAARIAELRCERDEPGEFAKLAQLSPGDHWARATFLRRYFPVPSPGHCGPGSWDIEQMRLIGRRMAHSVDADSDNHPHHPEGWRATLTMFNGLQ